MQGGRVLGCLLAGMCALSHPKRRLSAPHAPQLLVSLVQVVPARLRRSPCRRVTEGRSGMQHRRRPSGQHPQARSGPYLDLPLPLPNGQHPHLLGSLPLPWPSTHPHSPPAATCAAPRWPALQTPPRSPGSAAGSRPLQREGAGVHGAAGAGDGPAHRSWVLREETHSRRASTTTASTHLTAGTLSFNRPAPTEAPAPSEPQPPPHPPVAR